MLLIHYINLKAGDFSLKEVLLRDGDAVNDWIQLFNTETMEGLDMIRTRNAGVAEAVEVVRRMSLGRMARETYESYMKAKMDRRAEDEFVRNEGKAEGKAEGTLRLLTDWATSPGYAGADSGRAEFGHVGCVV